MVAVRTKSHGLSFEVCFPSLDTYAHMYNHIHKFRRPNHQSMLSSGVQMMKTMINSGHGFKSRSRSISMTSRVRSAELESTFRSGLQLSRWRVAFRFHTSLLIHPFRGGASGNMHGKHTCIPTHLLPTHIYPVNSTHVNSMFFENVIFDISCAGDIIMLIFMYICIYIYIYI